MARAGSSRQSVIREAVTPTAAAEEDTVPPVALRAAYARALRTEVAAAAAADGRETCGTGCVTTRRPTQAARPALRLVAMAEIGDTGEVVHGRGGPSTCGCRECTMARHPASMPRLRVV